MKLEISVIQKFHVYTDDFAVGFLAAFSYGTNEMKTKNQNCNFLC